MRVSLVSKFVLLLVAAVLLAVGLMGAGLAWNLRAGFSEYLKAQDERWLERFVAVAAAAVAEQGLVALSGPPGSLRPLVDATSSGTGLGAAPEPMGPAGSPGQRPNSRLLRPENGRPARPDDARPPRPEAGRLAPDDKAGRAPRDDVRGGPPGRGGHPFGSRLLLLGADGMPLSGRPAPPGAPVLERPIVVDGRSVAQARLWASAPVEAVDIAFLARQYQGMLLMGAGGALLIGVAVAALGRRWLRPLAQAQAATRRIAEGALDVRLLPRGDDELADLGRDINAMAAALQGLEASRRRWIAELSHEMRTPLAVLRGEIECLLDGVRPLDTAALQSLQTEVARLTRLMDDFHQLALSDLRALPCSFAALAPAELLQAAVTRLAPRATAAGLVLSCQVQAAPPQACWDRQRIEQLLLNLLENSLRYTDAPGQVRLSLASQGTAARLTLDDSAPGVPAADLPRLFDPLFRADTSRSRASGGSGLGLAICRAIVSSHGGQMEAAASALGGLSITVVLPLQPRPAAASAGGPA